jgi:hypothetical protein
MHKAAVVLSFAVQNTSRELTLELQQSSLSIVIKFDLGLASAYKRKQDMLPL